MKSALRIRPFPAVLFVLVCALMGWQPVARAQEMGHHQAGTPSTQLMIHGIDGKSITLTPEELAALPHKTVSVFNSHTRSNESYSGVALADLLVKVGVPQGENVKGKAFMTAVVAEGTDKYSVLFALAEVDPSIHAGDVIVADLVNDRNSVTTERSSWYRPRSADPRAGSGTWRRSR